MTNMADEAAAEFTARPDVDLEAEAKRIFADDLVETLDPVIRDGIAYDPSSGERLGAVSPLGDNAAPADAYRKPRGRPRKTEPTRTDVTALGEPRPPDELQLHRKLAEVMGIVERIPKRGVAPREMGGFAFVQVGDAAAAIRTELAARHVTLTPIRIDLIRAYENPTRQGGVMSTETYGITWQFTDGDSGEIHTIYSVGTGADRGDKAAPKAQTNAMKYALLMAFLMPTGDDPELEDSSDRQQKTSVVIEDSHVTGVRQGGRQTESTQAQIVEVGRFARKLHLGPLALAAIIDDVLPGTPVPPFEEGMDTAAKTNHILAHLKTLDHDAMASVIQVLMDSKPPKEDTDGSDPETTE